MKRVFWILITPLSLFLVSWFAYANFISPKLNAWLLATIQSYSRTSLPVEVKAEKLELSLLKPSLSLENIDLIAKDELALSLQKMHVNSVRVHIDFLHLLSGRLTLSAVIIDTPKADINLDPLLTDDSPPQELPMDLIFAQIEKIPLKRILLKDTHLKLYSEKSKMNFETHNADLLVTNMGQNLTGKLNIAKVQGQLPSWGEIKGALNAHLYLTRQSLRVLQLGVQLEESEVMARGELTQINQLLIKPRGVVDFTARVRLDELHNEWARIRPDIKIPHVSGELSLEANTRFEGMKDLYGKMDITTKALVVDNFELGDARIQGEYKNETISLSQFKVLHPAGEAVLTNSQISLAGNSSFQSKVKITSLDFQKLMQTLDLNGVPVGMDLQGELPCEGQIFPTFIVTCTKARISAHDLWVKADSSENAHSIVNVQSMSALGQVQITPTSVSYAANVNLGDSSGTSHGVIDFNEGFKISFKTDKLDFSNIQNLSNLKLIGWAGIEGSTSGDSNSATFEMKLKARDFTFETFNLGNFSTDLKYQKGTLYFENIAGAIDKTVYLGNLDVDLVHEKLKGQFNSPTTELKDVAFALAPFYKFPVGVQGSGSFKAQIDGPLNFWKLNYEMESSFKRVAIGAENFDRLHFNVTAKDGNIKTKDVSLKRNQSTLVVEGDISSQQVLNLNADGKNWKLEESDFLSINKTNSSIVGQLNFSAQIKDAIRDPHVIIKGAVTDTLLEEQEIPNSNFILRLDLRSFGAKISLFGDKVQGEMQWPLEKGRTPLIIKATTNNWNYSTLLGLIGGSSLANEYSSALTSSVDLRSESGDIFRASGHMNIQTLNLKRGSLSFANSSPIEINATDGRTTIKNFKLEGPNSRLQIRGESFTADDLNMAVNLQTDLRLLHIFMPFLEDLGGGVNLSTTLSGSLKKPEILGNLQNQNAYIKIKGFPHPVEKLSTDVVFSQSKILINSIKGQMAGGTLKGDGEIAINGIKDLPTTIRLHLESVKFNVPEKVESQGRADLLLSGSWFPFTLSGTYHISNAYVTKDFTEQTEEVTGIRQSLYLPKVIRESNFQPLILDLQVLMDRNIIVKNALLDGSVMGQLQIKGALDNLLLFGKINIEKKSKLIFKDKIFEVQNGLIEFNDPNEVNPILYITALSRIDKYDITLLAQGSSKNLTIRTTSVPPLPEQDIISLIALGVTSTKMDQTLQSRQQAEQLGVEIGGAVLAKPINKQLESTLGLNLQVTSAYDSTRNISVPKVTLSRRLSERVKVSGSRPVRDTQSYDLKVEYRINSNITAVGSFENRGVENNPTLQTTQPSSQNIFGLDLEFKREFK